MIAGCVFLKVQPSFRSFLLFAMVRRVYKFARYSATRNIKKNMGGLIMVFTAKLLGSECNACVEELDSLMENSLADIKEA